MQEFSEVGFYTLTHSNNAHGKSIILIIATLVILFILSMIGDQFKSTLFPSSLTKSLLMRTCQQFICRFYIMSMVVDKIISVIINSFFCLLFRSTLEFFAGRSDKFQIRESAAMV